MKLNLFADPPLQPAIHGYTEGVSIAKGTVQHISCISTGGNPPATLTWYKNDQKINSTTKSSDKSVSAELNIVASAADNGARYRCEATNSATEVPLHEVITLDVNFAPEHVKIRQEPDKLRPGQRATLTCETSASKPPAHLTWWRSGIPVNTAPGATSNATRAGLYGGKVTSSSLTLDVTPDMNGLVYTCQATNEALQVSAHDATTLNIVYKPTFENEPPVGLRQVTAVEGEGTMIQLEPRANPPSMTFTWSKDGHPLAMNARVITDGATLNITTVRKEDAGTYSLEAVNSEGSTTAKIVLSVHYPPVILEIPRSVLVAESEDATISCTADGNPLVEANFQWKREDFDLASRTTQSFRNGTSYLRVIGTTTEDMGNFECHVSNGVGEPTMAKSMLLVKHKPKMDLSPSIAKAASNAGDMGRLICRAQGAPSVGFNWSREGSPIHPEVSDYFSVEYKEVDLLTYESALIIHKVRPSDYGGYECVARNEMGFATATIRLEVTSAPDPPLALSVLNVTHDSVRVSWKPGFNGGLKQSFKLRYRRTNTEDYAEVNVPLEETTEHTITGLTLATEYVFSVMAYNRLGKSAYLTDNVRAKTLNESPEAERERVLQAVLREQGDLPRVVIIAVSATAGLLVLINVALVLCFIQRKRRKRDEQTQAGASEQGSSKSATIEMYAPSSFNETVTGETLSSISEKSETYSNGEANEEFIEAGSKRAATTYLIDQVEPPAQYAYRPPPPQVGSATNTLTRHKPSPVPPQELDEQAVYVDSLRRNAYNHALGDKSGYNTPPPMQQLTPTEHMHPLAEPTYYISADSRYIYPPPPGGFGRPVGNGTLRHMVPPPDVTMSVHQHPGATPHQHPQGPMMPPVSVARNNGPITPAKMPSNPTPPHPHLSTFNPNMGHHHPPVSTATAEIRSLETEGHLV
ncbi:hypothetical protein B566_EDAN007873 [Ephemera danica]|nr:hypothetical protein B566_EDAN007873 [Ephemera danica]